MSFKQWLFDLLTVEEVIDETWDEEEFNTENLIQSTELDEADIESYRRQFEEHCDGRQVEPLWDLDD